MIYKLKVLYLIFFITLSSIFLVSRLYKISEVPNSLYWDEASIGYNAYSILKTGKDEWGEFLPIHFRAFGEFKLPTYIYSVVLTTKFFGLSTFSVRLPAVLYSFATIIVFNLIVNKLLKNNWFGLLAMFFLVTSPWLFLFSRTGYEVTAGIFFYVLSLYFFIISLEKRRVFLLSVLFLIASFYSYNSFRIVTPLSFFIFSIYFIVRQPSKLKHNLLLVTFSLAIFCVSLFPFYRLIKQDFGLSRLSSVQEKNIPNIFVNYVSHFKYRFLVSQGDTNPRSHVPGSGQIWVFDSIVLVIGLLTLVKLKDDLSKLWFFVLLISVIPAAITKESPHALRSLNSLLPLSFFWVVGLGVISKVKKYGSLLVLFLIVLNSLLFYRYFINYLNTYNSRESEHWQIQYKEIFKKYDKEIKTAQRVVITDKYAQPYIYALYYQSFDPANFQLSKSLNPVNDWGISTVSSFDKFEFREASKEDVSKGFLVFSKSNLGPESSKISLPNGEVMIYVYNTK